MLYILVSFLYFKTIYMLKNYWFMSYTIKRKSNISLWLQLILIIKTTKFIVSTYYWFTVAIVTITRLIAPAVPHAAMHDHVLGVHDLYDINFPLRLFTKHYLHDHMLVYIHLSITAFLYTRCQNFGLDRESLVIAR